jgi:hypothetical protein
MMFVPGCYTKSLPRKLIVRQGSGASIGQAAQMKNQEA